MTGSGLAGCRPGRVVALWLLASLSGVAHSAAQVKRWPSESPPRPLAAPEVGFPSYRLRTLSNGLQAIAVVHTEQPAVTLRLIVRAGAAEDPPGRAGLAALASRLLDQGTATRSAGEVAEAVDAIGGALEIGVGRDLTFADLVVLKTDAIQALDLLSDIVRRPAFAPEEIERQRRQVLAGLRVAAEDPEYIADAVVERLVYGFGPYGIPGNGTPETVAAITREELVGFHDRHFAPNNTILAVVGDIGADEAFAAVDRTFGTWARKDLPELTPAEPPPPARRVVVIDRPGAAQTEIRVGQLATPRRQPGFRALELMANILGGEGANRLHRILRTERGLTYGAKVSLEPLQRAGLLVASTNTRPEATAETLRLVVDEFARIRRERVDHRELSDAKAYLTGSYPLAIETPNAIATHVLDHVFYGLPLEDLDNYRKQVTGVTIDDVARAAWDTIRPDRLSVVLVGDAATFTASLRGVGFGRFELVPLDELDLLAAGFRRE